MICSVCLRHNAQDNIKPKGGKFPPTNASFEAMHMDFIELNQCERKKYCSVLIDPFTKWIELFPVTHPDALTEAKVLRREIIS